MNAATGVILVLPAYAADSKMLHTMAAHQLSDLLAELGINGTRAQAELDALAQPFAFTHNSNRSLVASMNQRKYGIWLQFTHHRARPTR